MNASRRWHRTLLVAFAVALVLAHVFEIVGLGPGPIGLVDYLCGTGNPFGSASFLGAFLVFAARERGRPDRLALAVSVGCVAEAWLFRRRLSDGMVPYESWLRVGLGLGTAALAVTAWGAIFGPKDARATRRADFAETATLPVFMLTSSAFLDMTAVVHPRTLDAIAYRADASFGLQPSFEVAHLFAAHHGLARAAAFVYGALPLALALVQVLDIVTADTSKGRRPPGGVVLSYVLVAATGFAFYLAFPVVGPGPAFPEAFPNAPMALDTVASDWMVVDTSPRNCMPSLHTAWALMVFFRTRKKHVVARGLAIGWLALTELATLGFGFHYLVDLVAAVPFTVAADGLASSVEMRSKRGVRRWVAVAFGGVVLWLVGLWVLAPHVGSFRLAIPLLASFVLGGSVLVRGRITALEDEHTPDLGSVVPDEVAGPFPTKVALAFVFSGFAGLVYEVVFAKSLALTFGSTSSATTTVLATYMGGLGLGAYLGGKLTFVRARPLLAYALCELGVALSAALAPASLALVHAVYVSAAAGAPADSPKVTALRVALGVVVLLPPTVLMGITTPALAAFLERRKVELGGAVTALYTANTAGAGAGALLTGYVLLGTFGVTTTTRIAIVANGVAAALALLLARSTTSQPPGTPTSDATHGGDVGDAASRAAPVHARSLGRYAFATLAVAGVVSLAAEVVYVHLLAVVVGNSVYAFSLMLAVFLVGLSAGSRVSARVFRSPASRPWGLVVVQACLASALLLGLGLWDAVPDWFAHYETYAGAKAFGQREFVRGVASVVLLFPTAFLVGASYPLAMGIVVGAEGSERVGSFAKASAANTAGNIVGALGAHFVLVPFLGSAASIRVLAATSLALSVAGALVDVRLRTKEIGVAVAIAAGLFVVAPKSFDLTRLASGANVYFQRQAYGTVVDHAESSDGGLTTVAESDQDGRRVLTLLTNGKFQGDDSEDREVPSQFGIALTPIRHTEARSRALVIGYGTGASARAVEGAGFRTTDVVDLSSDIVRMANRHFASINDLVSTKPDVRTVITDGRNYLTLTKDTFDLVSMEISSIWFAGAASLYNREFYALARGRLSARGVLQQWIQLHRLSADDIATVLRTIRTEFDHVWLYFVSRQGVIVACAWDCSPTVASEDRLDREPKLAEILRIFGGSSHELGTSLLLDPAGVDRFVASRTATSVVSTDDNLHLEYATPRANVRPYGESIEENTRTLRAYADAVVPSFAP
ncbi:MAG: fused MFS/spermidine synthase [Polyangiaceae bacterium]